MHRSTKILIAAGLIACSVAVRLRFLSGMNSDGDIGLYVLVSRAWLHGALPYTTIWEYKPPGLFAMYAAALAVFGDASRAVNTLAIVASTATTLILWRLVARAVPNGEVAGVVAAIFWACLSIENQGLLGDAELLTVPFAAGALLALTGRPTPWRFAISGLLAAGAVQMKLTALPFVALPFVLALRAGGLRALAAFGCSFFVPVFVEAAIYARMHQLSLLLDVNVGATIRRAISRAGVSPLPADYWDQIRQFSPAIELAPFAALRRDRWVSIFVVWLLIALATLVAVGEYDTRQFIPLVAPVAVLGAIGVDTLVRRFQLRSGPIWIAAALAFALHGYYEVKMLLYSTWETAIQGQPHKRDDELISIVDEMQRHSLSGGVWIVEQTPLLYDMLHQAPPSRYPLTSDLLDRRMWPMLGFDGRREIADVIEARQPAWILAKPCGPWADPAACRAMWNQIRVHYRAVGFLNRTTTLYRRVTTRTALQWTTPKT